MKLTKCANGHFYDAEKYSSCPHCPGGAAEAPGGGYEGATEPFYADQGAAMPFAGGSGSDVTEAEQMPRGNENPTMPMFNNGMGIAPQQGSGRAGSLAFGNNSDVPTDENKTVGIMAWGTHATEGAGPQGQENPNQYADNPVVGWLVCIKGKHYGRAFELHGGRNFIGRDPEMDICLAGDQTVARRVHASIIYEPRQRKFFAQPGESRSLFYVNDEVVLASVELQSRDVLLIGETTMVFVPFCDETYGWGV